MLSFLIKVGKRYQNDSTNKYYLLIRCDNFVIARHRRGNRIRIVTPVARNAIHFKIIYPEIESDYNHFFHNSLAVNDDDTIRPGMNFCRLALMGIDGEITYKALPEKELEFIISIPN